MCNFSHQMQVLFRQEPRYEYVAILLIEDLNPYESLSGHDSLHKSEIKALNHNDSENNCEWGHDNPILNIVNTKDRCVNAIIDAIAIFVGKTVACGNCSRALISVVLLKERVQEKSALSEGDQQDE